MNVAEDISWTEEMESLRVIFLQFVLKVGPSRAEKFRGSWEFIEALGSFHQVRPVIVGLSQLSSVVGEQTPMWDIFSTDWIFSGLSTRLALH
jgi:hypothetical protein